MIQPKLRVSEPGDRYEKEAERIADTVMRMPEPESTEELGEDTPADRIQRMCPRCQRRYWQGKPLNCEECEAELPRSCDGTGDTATSDAIEQAAEVAEGMGRPLSDDTQLFFESRMGRDFSDVQIHTGGKAERAARSINARAYTIGSDVVFRSGKYRPDTQDGKRLLAHELTHVVQQRGRWGDAHKVFPSQKGNVSSRIQRQDGSNGEGNPDDRSQTSEIDALEQGPLRAAGLAVGLGPDGSARAKPSIQPKLTVNEPGDRYEKEAERVADAVMRMPDATDTGIVPLHPFKDCSEQGVIFRRVTAKSAAQQQMGKISIPSGAGSEKTRPQETPSPLADPAEQFVPDRPMGDVERQQYWKRLRRGEHYRQMDRPMGESERQVVTMPRRKDQNLKLVNELSASKKVRNFVKEEEGFVPEPYNDGAGNCTIGYGHLIKRGKKCNEIEISSKFKGGITKEKANSIFLKDIRKISSYFKPYIEVPLTQYEFDALASFAFNTGHTEIKNSGIAEAINNRNFDRVPDLIKAHDAGPSGIPDRRKKEARMFEYGEYP